MFIPWLRVSLPNFPFSSGSNNQEWYLSSPASDAHFPLVFLIFGTITGLSLSWSPLFVIPLHISSPIPSKSALQPSPECQSPSSTAAWCCWPSVMTASYLTLSKAKFKILPDIHRSSASHQRHDLLDTVFLWMLIVRLLT